MKVYILNGPNLGRLGLREPAIYGSTTFSDLINACEEWAGELSLEVNVWQTDSEAQLIEWIQLAQDQNSPVILNAGAFTHYSYSLAEACENFSNVLIEVHLSNPHSREEFRHKSVISHAANGVIVGFGINSYKFALEAIKEMAL